MAPVHTARSDPDASALCAPLLRAVQRVAAEDVATDAYLRTLTAVQAQIDKRSPWAPAVWTEMTPALLSELDHVRRDVRHLLVDALHALGVFARPHAPFRFAAAADARTAPDAALRAVGAVGAALLPVVARHVPDARALERRVAGAAVGGGWTVARVSVGAEPVLRTHATAHAVHADAALTVRATVRHADRRTVECAADYPLLALTVELAASPRHAVLREGGVARRVAPTAHVVRTLTPAQWVRYAPPTAAAVWSVLHHVGRDAAKLRALDARLRAAPPVSQLRSALPLRGARSFARSALAAVPCAVPEAERAPARVVAGAVQPVHPYLADGRWVLVAADGTAEAPRALVQEYLARTAVRHTADHLIASHMLDRVGEYHVRYVSGASLHDTFF